MSSFVVEEFYRVDVQDELARGKLRGLTVKTEADLQDIEEKLKTLFKIQCFSQIEYGLEKVEEFG